MVAVAIEEVVLEGGSGRGGSAEVAVAVVAAKMEVVVVMLFISLKLKIKVTKSYFVLLKVWQNCFKIEYVIKIFQLQNLKSGNYLTRVLMNYIFQGSW